MGGDVHDSSATTCCTTYMLNRDHVVKVYIDGKSGIGRIILDIMTDGKVTIKSEPSAYIR